jgi:four helix bundle protein
MTNEDLKNRTKTFAHRCVKLSLSLHGSIAGKHIQRQLIRCATSVAANYRAACLAQSKAAFISKLSIVIEEADESVFWLEFIIDEKLIDKQKIDPLLNESQELAKIFISSRMTATGKSKN